MSDDIKGQDSLLLICIAIVQRYYGIAYANIMLEEISKLFSCPREKIYILLEWNPEVLCNGQTGYDAY